MNRTSCGRWRGLWLHRNFRNLWAAQAISALGSRITREALPMAAILLAGAAAEEMGILASLATAPAVAVGLLAGGWVDRTSRRRLLIGADLARAALLISIPVAAFLHRLTLGHLYAVTAGVAAFTALFEIADNAYLPSLIPRKRLVEGNSKLEVTSELAEIGGPALAGVLVQVATVPMAILADAVTYLFSAMFLGRINDRGSAPDSKEARRSRTGDIVIGWRVLFCHPLLRPLVLAAVTSAFFGSFFAPLYSLYALRELGLTPAMLGVTIACGGVGGIIGALAAPRIVRRLGVGATLTAGCSLGALTYFLIPLAVGPASVSMAMLVAAQVLGDGLLAVYLVNDVALRQTAVPNEMMGRVGAAQQVLRGVRPVGALAAGFLAGAIGVRPTLFIAVVGLLSAALWLVASPIRQVREMPPSEAALEGGR